MTIESFRDSESLAIYNGDRSSKKARNRLPVDKWSQAQDCMRIIQEADTLRDVKSASLGLDQKKGDRKEQLSVRIDDQYRICFYWYENEAHAVEVVDYH